MPDWKNLYKLVTYIERHNTKDYVTEEAHYSNLTDPNYIDTKAITEEFALRRFKEANGLDDVKVSDTYKSAQHLGLVEKRIPGVNSTHVNTTSIIVTEQGRSFIHRSKHLKLKTGKWDAVVRYFIPWSTAIAFGSLIISIIALIVTLIK